MHIKLKLKILNYRAPIVFLLGLNPWCYTSNGVVLFVISFVSMNKIHPVLMEISHESQMKNLSCLGIEQLVGMSMHRKIWCEALYTSMICKQKSGFVFSSKERGWKGKSPYPSCLGMAAYHQSVKFTLCWVYQCFKSKFHLPLCSSLVLRLDMLYLGSDLKAKEKVLEMSRDLRI